LFFCAGKFTAEAESDYITEHAQHEKPRQCLCLVGNRRFTKKGNLIDHDRKKSIVSMYSVQETDYAEKTLECS